MDTLMGAGHHIILTVSPEDVIDHIELRVVRSHNGCRLPPQEGCKGLATKPVASYVRVMPRSTRASVDEIVQSCTSGKAGGLKPREPLKAVENLGAT